MLVNFLTYLSIFMAVFSSIALIKIVISFISALFSNPPKKFVIGDRALIIYGFLLSYLITYIIYLNL